MSLELSSEQMNIVIVGHVDHGKSTLIGRLLADTGSLPQGKLEAIRDLCRRTAKPFEYAFLLDALKDEQAQGITIDTARSFFKTSKRHYIVIDAPGHIEFLKNMVTGAARAEAALLLIDAKEGIQENSRRHGFMASLLGIKQLVVLVNKMDLVAYDEAVYQKLVTEYTQFLTDIGAVPIAFVPISARDGVNLAQVSPDMPWYQGPSVLELMDGFEKEPPRIAKPFRLPVQDVYKFTKEGDDRRIVAGTVETGMVSVGDEVVFLPSQKKSRIASIEGFNQPVQTQIGAGVATGFTLETQIYIRPGEMMCKVSEAETHPWVGSTFRANVFWLGRNPLVKTKKYKLKLATGRTSVRLKEIVTVLDASDLSTEKNKEHVDRHDVAECVFQTLKPLAFDLSSDLESTGRFVLIDDYEIAGGGIVTAGISDASIVSDHVEKRHFSFVESAISAQERSERFRQKPRFIVLTGPEGIGKTEVAKALEAELFHMGYSLYYMGISNPFLPEEGLQVENRDEHIMRIGELAHLFTEAGLIFMTTISDLDDQEIGVLRALNAPHDILVVSLGKPMAQVDGVVENSGDVADVLREVKALLVKHDILLEYYL